MKAVDHERRVDKECARDRLQWGNTVPKWGYLLGLNIFVSVVLFFPAAVLLRRVVDRPLRAE